MIVIVYTTEYRKGSDKFEKAAKTMVRELKQRSEKQVICKGILGKRELTNLFNDLAGEGKQIDEFHFIVHSGMYGPMYGTVQYPEQYSPYELKTLQIPFANNAKAFFHCCRSARWFAPFFSEVFKVETFGYHWYTSFSSDKKRYKRINDNSESVYAIGCMGKKSHGLIGSIKKHSGMLHLEQMRSFKPGDKLTDASYNKVAGLYDNVFKDIKVRKDEWKWMCDHLQPDKTITVIDIGCGNGALLKELAPQIHKGIGIDVSTNIIERAKQLNKEAYNLEFMAVTSPSLPVQDQSVDVVISLLSFRYLDWDPIMNEIKRILKPSGKILIIDMVTVPVRWKEYPALVSSKIRQYLQRITDQRFYHDLKKLVTDSGWKQMLKHNPIRAEHEMKWYLESRFPGKKVEKINVGWHSCILAFDSGNIENIKDINLTYP
jgi:ubiquinone/menaquinone biosynthesis C-methylase UbiE